MGAPNRSGDRGEWPVYTADSTDPNIFSILDYIELAYTMSARRGLTTGHFPGFTPIVSKCSTFTTPPDFDPIIAETILLRLLIGFWSRLGCSLAYNGPLDYNHPMV
jgi:hypothetical protein